MLCPCGKMWQVRQGAGIKRSSRCLCFLIHQVGQRGVSKGDTACLKEGSSKDLTLQIHGFTCRWTRVMN